MIRGEIMTRIEGENTTLVTIVVILVLIFLGFAMMMFGPAAGMMGYRGMMGWGMGSWWMFFIPVISFALILIGVFLLLGSRVEATAEVPKRRALEILKECNARGEVTAEEFQRIKKEIE